MDRAFDIFSIFRVPIMGPEHPEENKRRRSGSKKINQSHPPVFCDTASFLRFSPRIPKKQRNMGIWDAMAETANLDFLTGVLLMLGYVCHPAHVLIRLQWHYSAECWPWYDEIDPYGRGTQT